MAIPWLVVLQNVPWRSVISNAPKVADGAKRLWDAVSGQPPVQVPPGRPAVAPASDAEALAALQARLLAMEEATDALHTQMLASSELIKSLAEQNAQLIKRIETCRVRLGWLAAAVLAVGSVASVALGLLLSR